MSEIIATNKEIIRLIYMKSIYLKNGFLIIEGLIDEPTVKKELLMEWKRV